MTRVSENGSDTYWMDELAKWDALEVAVRQLLEKSSPPWWSVRRIGLKRKRGWTLRCIHYMWPQWFSEALKCGVDPAALTAVTVLVMGDVPAHTLRHADYHWQR